MSASLALLQEKYVRAMAFGRYLEEHPSHEDPLTIELRRELTRYRIALHNVIEDQRPKEVKLRGV